MAGSPYTFENEVFSNLVFYSTLVLLKTALMTLLTSYNRIRTGSFVSVEDVQIAAPNDPDKQKKMLRKNDDVERIRAAHLNDLENVIPFVLLSLLYVGTNPNPVTALWHFRTFVFSRFLHSFVYTSGIRQPFRFIFFTIGYGCFFSMAFRILCLFY